MKNGHIANEPVLGGTVLLLYSENTQGQGNSQSSRLQSVLNDHAKIGPVTGIEVCKYPETLVIEVQVP